MYDIFYVSQLDKNKNQNWQEFKLRYSAAKYASSVVEAQKKSLTKFFWIVWDDLVVDQSFKFDYEPDEWSKEYIHVFKNNIWFDGICLFPKKTVLTQKEIDHRFFVNKKEIDIVASMPKPYDIAFISYQEPNADENYEKLLKRNSNIKRIHGVKGIHQAHIAAAELCKTDMIWIVDGDAVLVDDFDFDYQVARWDQETVHVWRSQNPVNGLVYGYGGVKLFPRNLTISMDVNKPDMTTSISSKFKAVQEVSNITEFNTDPFNTWKSAFRECVKLSSKAIDRQKDEETVDRLNIWRTVGENAQYGKYAIAGAIAGAEYGSLNRDNITALKLINDFNWLKEHFNDL